MKNSFLVEWAKRAWQEGAHFLFPPFCFHCRGWRGQAPILCALCQEQMALLDPLGRCKICFRSLEEGREVCKGCLSASLRSAAALEYEGAAVSMIRQLKYQDRVAMAKALAPFLAAQWARLDWPRPNFLVPMPQTWTHRLRRGYNQSFLLAKELGNLLDLPVKEVLRRNGAALAQSGKSRSERLQLSAESFRLKKESRIADQIVLLIDDVITTGATVRCAAEVLQEGMPSQVFALAVAMA